MTKMTEAELLEQVAQALELTEAEDGAMTVMDLADSLGMGLDAVRRRLRPLIQNGTIEVIRTQRKNISGIVQHRRLYKLAKRGEAKITELTEES